MNQQQSWDNLLVREAEMVADHFLNENLKLELATKARLVIAIQFPDPGVAERLVKELEVTEEEANVMFLDCKLFLWACTQGKGMCPTKPIDEAWHTFILFTQNYFEFCKQVAGQYLHHVPHVGDNKPDAEASQALFDKTQETILRLFNVDRLSDNWKLYARADCGCARCNSCRDCACALKEPLEMKFEEPTLRMGGGCSFAGQQERVRQVLGGPMLMKSPAMQTLQGIGDCSFSPACECGDSH